MCYYTRCAKGSSFYVLMLIFPKSCIEEWWRRSHKATCSCVLSTFRRTIQLAQFRHPMQPVMFSHSVSLAKNRPSGTWPCEERPKRPSVASEKNPTGDCQEEGEVEDTFSSILGPSTFHGACPFVCSRCCQPGCNNFRRTSVQ